MPSPLSTEAKALIDRPNFAHLATLMADGSPHSVPVWVGREGDRLLVCSGHFGPLEAGWVRPPIGPGLRGRRQSLCGRRSRLLTGSGARHIVRRGGWTRVSRNLARWR